MEKNEKLKQYAQELRKNATKEENLLWYKFLRHYPVQFRRQCPLTAISWISTAPRHGWWWSWTALSTMIGMEWSMTGSEQAIWELWVWRFCAFPTQMYCSALMMFAG